MIDVRLLYFDACPNWKIADERLRTAIAGRDDVELHYRHVSTVEDAERLGFAGSPTILVDGRDPFAEGASRPGLSCRIYSTPDGPAGSPTVGQLMAALSETL